MNTGNSLQRYIDAQEKDYETALYEIRQGRKRSHWMWYVFPQLRGLGSSEASRYYGIQDIEEAKNYLLHPVLGPRLTTICKALLVLTNDNATAVLGNPDDLKLKSCMTLFAAVPGTDPVFQGVLDKFFSGSHDIQTLNILGIPE